MAQLTRATSDTAPQPTPATPALDGLSVDQAVAVRAVRGPVCIIAGAGSGKTRTITHRIAEQIRRGVARADQIMALTFTERAAAELKARLDALGSDGRVRATTFHAAAFAQIRYFWRRAYDGDPPQVLDRKVPLLLPLARSAGVEASDLASEIEWAKARLVTPERYAQVGRHRDAPLPAEQMAALYTRYEALKTDRGLIDFDDMLHVAVELLDDDGIAAEVRDRYRYFTVDEFQDVNPAQWQLLRRWLGDRDELCVVGDPDQTIYSFSGATSEYLRNFRTTFPTATMVTLTDNYRSTAPVLDVANRLLRAAWPDAKQLRAQRDDGPRPRIMAFDDDRVERARTLDWIRDLIDDGVPIDEIAVCVRTNAQTQAWEEAFERAGVAARVHGDRGFFDRPEVRQAMQAIRQAAAHPPVSTGATPPPPGTTPAGDRRPDRVVEQVLRERLSWHPRREPNGQAARRRWRNVAALHELVTRIVDERDDIDLPGLLAELAERARASGGAHPTRPAVTLLTLHKAKGSEFDAVCLVGLEEGMVPISYAVTQDDLDEERRLLYVGMTRARRHLWLSWAQQRPGWSSKPVRRRPSRFLDDVADRRRSTPGRGAQVDDQLAGTLRAWRLERARRDEVPPYVVFNDRTLQELAATRPTSVAELLAVHGLGTTKVRRYGRELLGLLAPAGLGDAASDRSRA
ncbi:MAG: ATP-dependent DNA helicase UvrD2 [Actinobacteria bacterium]|nr:ATP-dependent DNA helicase UvrD2 [Actinomycetota bacterium]